MTTIRSQNAAILDHLQAGLTITQADAISLFACYRLSARIYDLRRAGFDIGSTIGDEINSRFAQYFYAGKRAS
jgi:hypothetical protein